MKYENIIEGKFISRPNRFIAEVELNGKIERVHVKNTGRCKEILIPGAKVLLEDFTGRMGNRKMQYSLIGVEKINDENVLMINMDSQAPNKVAKEALQNNIIVPDGLGTIEYVKGEYTYGKSRLDFYMKDTDGKEALMEVKGVTLENDGVSAFPDAPTERGIKGIIFTKHTVTKTKSAAVSNFAPNSLTVFVFLAIVPSIASVKPQNRYKA